MPPACPLAEESERLAHALLQQCCAALRAAAGVFPAHQIFVGFDAMSLLVAWGTQASASVGMRGTFAATVCVSSGVSDRAARLCAPWNVLRSAALRSCSLRRELPQFMMAHAYKTRIG
jgi:hypothetical protein